MPYNLNFAPSSYFSDLNLKTRIRSRVGGQLRKEAVLKTSSEKFTPPTLLKGQLPEKLRFEQSEIHPQLMGGEYLPHMNVNEVEICRVVLQSTTLDITSIRVSLSDDKLQYFVSDEYEIFEYQLKYPSTCVPLTMAEMVAQIDDCIVIEREQDKTSYEIRGLIKPVLSMHLERGSNAQELKNFITVESSFYPELSRYYLDQISQWLSKQ